jgi:hypothetical protein
VLSESDSDLEDNKLEIDLVVTSPAQSSDSALLSEDDVVSPISKPTLTFTFPASSLRSEELQSELSAAAGIPKSSGSDQSSEEEGAGTLYLEQRDHTYLSKKQLPYLAANHVSTGPLFPGVYRSPRKAAERSSVSASGSSFPVAYTSLRKSAEKSSSVSASGSSCSRPVLYPSPVKVLTETAPSNPNKVAAIANPAVLEEHGYGINYAEEQQENIRRDHNYGSTSVLKGRKLYKFRKSVRANTQSNNLDHAYETAASGK